MSWSNDFINFAARVGKVIDALPETRINSHHKRKQREEAVATLQFAIFILQFSI
jgi:hypothetical protein